MNTKSLYDVKETISKDLEQYARKGSLTRNDLEAVHMMVDTLYKACKTSMIEDEGYSYGEGEWNASGNYSNANRRTGMGGNNSYGNNSYGNNSYGNGNSYYRRNNYSRANDENQMIMDRIDEMMSDSRMSQDEREILQRTRDMLRNK